MIMQTDDLSEENEVAEQQFTAIRQLFMEDYNEVRQSNQNQLYYRSHTIALIIIAYNNIPQK